ncbi:MAG: type transport system permease protein [Candidatus Binatota bacterium]|nr:type transport system permease protein [Candidatus Binatota bacterium]
MTTAFPLLRPRVLAVRNRWRRTTQTDHLRFAGLGLLAVVFWIGIFLFFARVLVYFQAIPELGPVLAERMLGMILLTFFSILLFSNVVTALSVFYLSADLGFLLAAPLPAGRLHVARFLETLWDSSWMILLFGLPVLLAYGVAHDAGPLFYLASLAVLPPFVVIPTAVGASVTMLLVRSFPARRTKDVFVLLTVIAVAVLYVFLRSLQPERLVRPEEFTSFVDFLAAVQAPTSLYLPSTWAAETLIPFLVPREDQSPLFYYAALASTAAAAFVVFQMTAERAYLDGWSRAQEGRRARLSRLPFWDRITARVPGVSRVARALVLKDAKTFFRDTAQWSQLVLLGALVVVYVYNFRVMPKGGGALVSQLFLSQALAFLNLALAGFVVASVAVRFVFPAVSLEGKSFWLLKTAPIRLRSLWWAKFWSGSLPLLALGLLLIASSNRVLQVDGRTMVISLATLALMTLAITALGLCFGVFHPRFDYENVAQIPSSVGGVLYMISAITFIGANVALEAWPQFRILFAGFRGRALTSGEWAGIIVSYGLVVLLDIGVLVVACRFGIRRLEALEP